MIVQVKLYDEVLGVVEWDDTKNSSSFQYSDSAVRKGIEPSPKMLKI